jgi:pyruvate dehydrogenase phosphatase
LPIIVRDFLRDTLGSDLSRNFTPELIANLFSRSMVAFDDAIANDVLDLFGGIEGLNHISDSRIRNIINDQHRGGHNWKKARLCMYGTTALVALVDPDHKNLWVANLGDCQASKHTLTSMVATWVDV